MRKNAVVGLFVCVSLLQVIVPLSMITKRESILNNGEQFKFKTAPVDPYDAFRGRYVALRIEEDKVSNPGGLKLAHDQTVYALITVDDQGFAKFTRVRTSKPRGKPYIQAKVQYTSGDKIHLNFPIDRYYMEESAAPAAERIYARRAQRGKKDAYIIVRIKDGFAVIESLYIGDQRIEDAVKQETK